MPLRPETKVLLAHMCALAYRLFPHVPKDKVREILAEELNTALLQDGDIDTQASVILHNLKKDCETNMRLSFALLDMMAQLEDTEAQNALQEWTAIELSAKQGNIPPPQLEAYFIKPDLFIVHALPASINKTITIPGMKHITLPGIPLPRIEIIDADGGIDEED